MKKTAIIICLLAVLLTGTGIFIGISGERKTPEDEKAEQISQEAQALEDTELSSVPELMESMAVPENYNYVIYEKDGVLMVYKKDGRTEYFETNIRVRDLEEAMMEKLRQGIYFETEEELYDFLENYSS